MMPGMNMKSTTNVKLPLSFIIYALIAFIVSQFILLFHTDLLMQGVFRIPPIWMAAHFLLLGFVIMVIMGAMYQLVPVAFLTPIWNQTFGYIQYVITITGITAFALLLGFATKYAIYGAALALISIFMFIIQMMMTIRKQENKSMMTIFVLSALSCFMIAISAGFLLIWNINVQHILNQDALLNTHILFGIAGWFSLLIFGFSYKLIPMFSLSHGFSMKWAKPAFFSYVLGLISMMLSFWISRPIITTLGWSLLFIGFTFFALDVLEILKKRLRRRLDKPLSFSILAIAIGYVLHFIALLFQVVRVTDPQLWGWLIFLYLFCWVIFSILGYLYKIVPFLWWTHKYADQMGKQNVPTLAQMINEKWSTAVYSCFIIGIAGLLSGVFLQLGVVVFIFQAFLTLTTVVYVYTILKIFYI